MAALGSLVVSLAMDTAKFTGDVGKAAQQMGRLTAEAGKIGLAIGASIGVGAKMIGALVKESIDAADATSKLAQSIGVSTEAMSRLAYAADLAGTSQEELGTSMAKLARLAADAAAGGKTAGEVFAAMGVKVQNTDGTVRATEELLGDVADRFASYADGAAKTALAQEVFGRSGAKLIPFLNQGRDGLADLAREADLLGITLSTGAGLAAEQFNDNLTRLNKAKQGLGNTIAQQLLPMLQRMTDGLFDSAKNAELFDRTARIAVSGVKLLATAGAIIGGVFLTLGQYIGGLAATLVQFLSGKFAAAWETAKSTIFDFADNVRNSAGTVTTVWEDTANAVQAKAPSLGGKLAAPIITAAEKSGKAAKQIQSDAEKAYEAIEKRLQGLQFDVATQGASDRVRGLIELNRQGATGEQLRRYLDLSAAQESFRRTTEAAVQAQQDQHEIMAEGRSVFNATRTPAENLAQEIDRLNWLLQAGVINWDTYARAQFAAQDAFDESTKKNKEEADKLGETAKELGLTFSSAFEDAIVSGSSLRDLLTALEQDIIRIITRRLVTEPLGDFLSNSIKGMFTPSGGGGGIGGSIASFIGSMFAGGKANGGLIPAGHWGVVGERGPELAFGGNTGTTIQPNAGGMTINVNVQAQQGVTRASALQQGESIGRGIQLAMARNG